jgi:cytochrome c oxidase subunit 2
MSRVWPDAASAHAAALDAVLMHVHLHMAVVFTLWLGILVLALWKGRTPHPPGAPVPVPRRWPWVSMALVVAGDVVLLLAEALPAWHARMQPPSRDEATPLEIHIEAEQYVWHVHYAGPDSRFGRTDPARIDAGNAMGLDDTDPASQDDVMIDNVLMLPLGRPVVVQLKSRDVIHSFTLPEMRVKQDVTPGLTSRAWFTPVRAGAWDIACSQLCGAGHYRMRGQYRVLTPDAWQAWLSDEVSNLTSP